MRHARHFTGVLVLMSWAAAGAVPASPVAAVPAAPSAPGDAARTVAMDSAAAARFAALALKCLHSEYPSHISHDMDSDADARPPHVLNPAFYGCYDWHSDVHGHWLLVRLMHLFPDAPFVPAARVAIDHSLTAQNIAAEVAYLRRAGRASFERPYGLAWLLQLSAELRGWNDPQAREWASRLRPLEMEAASRLKDWVPKLRYAIRVGEHDQTAFSFGLMWDWAAVADDSAMRAILIDAAKRFYRNDRNCPIDYEPSGEDFLSPCLAEADFMRRTLDAASFDRWLSSFLPGIPATAGDDWLPPGVVSDRADPKLAHIDGLNLSRAWMLYGIAQGLPVGDRRIAALRGAAIRHERAAIPAVTGEHYEGGHWLGTFAVYLLSGAGVEH